MSALRKGTYGGKLEKYFGMLDKYFEVIIGMLSLRAISLSTARFVLIHAPAVIAMQVV